LKFQAIVEKIAKKTLGGYSLPHPVGLGLLSCSSKTITVLTSQTLINVCDIDILM